MGLGYAVYYFKEVVPNYEAQAKADLQDMYALQDNYEKSHSSYVGTFSQLGFSRGGRLNSNVLTSEDGRYRYQLVRIVPDQYGRIVKYSIEARPAA